MRPPHDVPPPAASTPDLGHRAARERRALWVATLLILVWGANFSVQKMVFSGCRRAAS